MRKCITFIFVFVCMTAGLAQKKNLLPDSLSFCYGDSAFVEIREIIDNHATIFWTTPQGIITNTKKVAAIKPGKYAVRVSSPATSHVYSDSCMVVISNKLKPMMRDTFMCKGKPIVLDAKHQGYRYLWSTGENSQKIQVENPGRYFVKIRAGSCLTVDSVKVRQVSAPTVDLPPDLTFCANEENKVVIVKTAPGTKLIWSTGANTPTIQVSREGLYWVKANGGSCGVQSDTVRVKFKLCECEMIIPGSFSPNEDNKNDYFFPVSVCEYSYYNLTITDRWGNSVFASSNINSRWDGRFKGNLCPEDIYVYRIESTEKGGDKKQVRTGHVSLFR